MDPTVRISALHVENQVVSSIAVHPVVEGHVCIRTTLPYSFRGHFGEIKRYSGTTQCELLINQLILVYNGLGTRTAFWS